VTRRGVIGLAAAALCIALATLLAFLAADVRAWPETFREGDFEYRAQPRGKKPWVGRDRLPFQPARRLLDVHDDVVFRRAIRLYDISTQESFGSGFRSTPRPVTPARRLLRVIDEGHEDPRVRSRAANFLGALAYSRGAFLDEAFARQALRFFRRAVQLDPTNEEAKFNLELMMYTSPEDPSQRRGGGGGGRATPDSGGAGSTPPGRGY
jgi:hypothetical protein